MSKTLTDRIDDLASDNSQRVKEAIRALSYVGADAVEPLIAALRAGNAHFENVAEALRQIGTAAVDGLTVLLVEPDPAVQQVVARALGYMRLDRAVVPLLMALQSPDPTTRETVAGALGNFTDLRAVGPLLELLDDEHETVRARAIQSLGSYAKDRRVIPALLEAATDATPLVRRGAIQGMARIQDERVIEVLNAATNDSDEDVRFFAAAALQHQRGDAMALQRVKGDVDDIVEQEVARILEDGKVDELDLEAMRNSNPKVRVRLMEKISEFGKTSSFQLVLPGLNDINPAVRRSAVETMARFGVRAIEGLAQLTEHPSVFTRSGAAEALGLIGDAHGVDALLKFLQDKEAQVRLSAVQALKQFPADERIITALKTATRDSEEAVSQQAAEVLQQWGVSADTPNPLKRFFRRLTGGS